jgi:hypothetical protein
MRYTFRQFARIAKKHGFAFEPCDNPAIGRYDLFSNEKAPGVTATYETLEEASGDIAVIAGGGNPLTGDPAPSSRADGMYPQLV